MVISKLMRAHFTAATVCLAKISLHTVEMGLGGGVTFTAYAWEKAHEQAIKDVEVAKQAAEKERLKNLEHDF